MWPDVEVGFPGIYHVTMWIDGLADHRYRKGFRSGRNSLNDVRSLAVVIYLFSRIRKVCV